MSYNRDKFGFSHNSRRSKAAAAYANGMTLADSANFSGDGKIMRNLLADSVKKGHKVFQIRRKPTDQDMTIFLVPHGEAPPAEVSDANYVEIGSPIEGKAQGLSFKPWKAPFVDHEADIGNAVGEKNFPVVLDEDDEPEYESEESEYESDDSESMEYTFALESHLQASLRGNLDQLEPGLKEIDGGREQNRRDITAKDTDGNVVVIELKAEKAMPDAVSQISAYMGEAMNDFNQTNEQVRGILVAGDFHEKVHSAAAAIPRLTLAKYRYTFIFEKFGSIR